jgi:pimeloyl-ACP methyl ester carboxylesterase
VKRREEETLTGNEILYHQRAGAGVPPILFVHGYLCNHDNWRAQMDRFAAAHQVVACDLRGMGRSPRGTAPMSIETLAADVVALMESLGPGKAVLVGHSMGCRVIMEACDQAPERVAGLVLVDGSRGGADRAMAERGFADVIAAHGYAGFVNQLFEDMFFDSHDPAWKAAALAGGRAVPEDVGSPLFRSLIAWDAERAETVMDNIRVPVLALQSTVMTPDWVRRRLAAGETSPYQDLVVARIGNIESETIAGAGHFTMVEAADVVNDRIERFIASKIA